VETKWLENTYKYDGSQLRSLYAYINEGILGDSVIAWRGPCDIAWEHMVDGEDLRAKSPICGADMVHFIVEKFDCTLLAAVALQRLVSAIAKDILMEKAENQELAQGLRREGDDLFMDNKKLSISIATVNPVSAMIHFAVNVNNKGTPVEALSLQELGIGPEEFANQLMNRFQTEIKTILKATKRVHWIK